MKRCKHIGSHESWLYDMIGNLRLKPLHENVQEHSHRLNVARTRRIDDSCHINKDRRGAWQTVVFDHQFNDSSPIVNADNSFGVYSHKSEMIVQAISNCHLWIRFMLCTETSTFFVISSLCPGVRYAGVPPAYRPHQSSKYPFCSIILESRINGRKSLLQRSNLIVRKLAIINNQNCISKV